MNRYKHYIFDMDGTITHSRQTIENDMAAALTLLKRMGSDVVVISGAERQRIEKQINYLDVSYVLAQSGADSPFWQKKMTERDEVEVWRHVVKIQKRLIEYNWGKGPEDERFVENRGGQITFSLTGFDCDLEVKKNFDPDNRRRQSILTEVPFHSLNLECRISGSTGFDYTYKDSNKGKNLERLLKKLNWDKDHCIYFGDKLMKGGGDETVVGVMKTVQVDGPEDLLEKLKDHI